MNVLYILAGLAGLLWVSFCGFMTYRSWDDKAKRWIWLSLSGVGLAFVVLAILRPGNDRTSVIEVKPYIREVAPTEKEKAKLDAQSEVLASEAGKLQSKGEALDKEAKELDAKKELLDAQSDKLDQDIADSREAADDTGSNQPDPDIADRLRNS